MRKMTLFWCVAAIVLAGCAEAPPTPMSVTPTPAATSTQSQTAVEQPAPAPKPRATGTPEDARRHMLRGMAAIEMAKSKDDLALAEDEFRMATEIAPQMANAWFNLGKVQTQLGHYGDAIGSYRQYLVLAPGAQDAPGVRDEIVKLEFRQEMVAKAQARVGTWVGMDGTPYNLTLDGNRLTLKTSRRPVPQDEVRSTYTLVGGVPVTVLVPAEYQLILHGNHLTGTWTRGAVPADKCTVPPDTSEVTGELSDKDGKMVLHHARTSYQANTQMSLLGDDRCASVVAQGRKTIEEVLYGPIAKGGLGAALYGITSWWDGGFATVHFGWQGRLAVRVQPGTPAFETGLRDEDEILAIDGVAVKSLSAGEAVARLRGEPGSKVNLEIWRKGNKDSVMLTLRRIEAPLRYSD
jgi:tetratricopeptide (TPR) repeat protein